MLLLKGAFALFLFVCEQPQGARRGKPNASLPALCTLDFLCFVFIRHFILSTHGRAEICEHHERHQNGRPKPCGAWGDAQGVRPTHATQRLFSLAVFCVAFFRVGCRKIFSVCKVLTLTYSSYLCYHTTWKTS